MEHQYQPVWKLVLSAGGGQGDPPLNSSLRRWRQGIPVWPAIWLTRLPILINIGFNWETPSQGRTGIEISCLNSARLHIYLPTYMLLNMWIYTCTLMHTKHAHMIVWWLRAPAGFTYEPNSVPSIQIRLLTACRNRGPTSSSSLL